MLSLVSNRHRHLASQLVQTSAQVRRRSLDHQVRQVVSIVAAAAALLLAVLSSPAPELPLGHSRRLDQAKQDTHERLNPYIGESGKRPGISLKLSFFHLQSTTIESGYHCLHVAVLGDVGVGTLVGFSKERCRRDPLCGKHVSDL